MRQPRAFACGQDFRCALFLRDNRAGRGGGIWGMDVGYA